MANEELDKTAEEELEAQALKKAAAAKKKADDEAKRKKAPPPKYYFDVKVECMLPATLTYRILAEDAKQAADLIKGKRPTSVQHKLIGRKELMLKVYDASGCMIRFMKKLLG